MWQFCFWLVAGRNHHQEKTRSCRFAKNHRTSTEFETHAPLAAMSLCNLHKKIQSHVVYGFGKDGQKKTNSKTSKTVSIGKFLHFSLAFVCENSAILCFPTHLVLAQSKASENNLKAEDKHEHKFSTPPSKHVKQDSWTAGQWSKECEQQSVGERHLATTVANRCQFEVWGLQIEGSPNET